MHLFDGIPKPRVLPTVQPTSTTEPEEKDFFKHHRIRVQNGEKQRITSFDALSNETCAKVIESLPYNTPTPVQAVSLPIITNGRDLLCIADTGSGKSLCFILGGILQLLKTKGTGTRMVIIVPTKELGTQLKKWLQIAPFSVAIVDRIQSYKQTILVATPLLLQRCLEAQHISLDLDMLVLDEADRLLNKQFLKDFKSIQKHLKTKQTIMTSATFPQPVEMIAKMIMNDPVRLTVGNRGANKLIKQSLVYCGNLQGKLFEMRQRIQQGVITPCLIFVNNAVTAKQLYKELKNDIKYLGVLHTYLTPHQRQTTLKAFQQKDIGVLITTDVLARGIDMDVEWVINFDIPTDIKVYIHRIGRTGRQKEGTSLGLYGDKDEDMVKKIANVMREAGVDIGEYLEEKRLKKNKKF